MTFGIHKILFCTDLSDNARYAFRFAAGLAAPYGADIVILHVIEGLTEPFKKRIESSLGNDIWEQIRQGQEADARRILIGKQTERNVLSQALQQFADRMHDQVARTQSYNDEIILRHGANVTEEILRTLRECQCDWVVMSAKGEGRLNKLKLGGTLKNVLKKSPVPVTIIPPPRS